jgi:hypothetical protein
MRVAARHRFVPGGIVVALASGHALDLFGRSAR